MPSTATQNSSTKSGIIATEAGDRHIPASVRPDGTLRKEIRVRPGYRPPEDVEVYKNRTAEHFKARGIPGAEYTDAPKLKPAKPTKPKVVKAEKKEVEEVVKEVVKEEPVDPEAEKEKEAKKLAKKLRQARELAQKKEEGGALLPEQFQKVIKISELVRQLEKLGYDLEGNKKT